MGRVLLRAGTLLRFDTELLCFRFASLRGKQFKFVTRFFQVWCQAPFNTPLQTSGDLPRAQLPRVGRVLFRAGARLELLESNSNLLPGSFKFGTKL